MPMDATGRVARFDSREGVVHFGALVLTLHRDSAGYELLIEAEGDGGDVNLTIGTATDEAVARLEL